jgi:signal transduction histidine kinase
MLNVIGRNAKKLQRLSEDILDVAKIENDSLKLNKGVFDLNEFILSIIGDFAEESRKENTKIVINQNINRDNLKERVFVKADKNRIGQVISNLLSNALKFTKNGTIDISIIKNAIHDNAICVIIKDTGTGISSEILPKIFTKFVTQSNKGTGLGLYISKKIVEAHEGKIWAENNFNDKGATFGFSLPLKISINLYP